MSLRIHNTLTRELVSFTPIEPGHVRMYVCGITIYDLCHVGHARMMVAFDLIYGWLRTLGYRVTYVRNITDIDDKIIRRSLERCIPIRQLTDEMVQAMYTDLDALGVARPTHEPRATEHVPQMLAMIGTLEAKGLAYRASNGDVNYSVRKFPGYGKLSGKSIDELRSGERVAVLDGKEDPLDFVLWKAAKPDEPEDAKYASGYGAGRPGWHIECSAMACALLGEQFDLHGGGMDLQFPHHENEIAQSEGANNYAFVNTFMHNGFVRVDEEKMSKSLGNFFTIREVLKKYDAEVVRFFILRAHYRSPLNYSDAHLDDAKAALTRLYTALKPLVGADVVPQSVKTIDWSASPHAARFKAAMDDDFNTPIAISVLFDLAGEANRTGDAALAAQLKSMAGVLGLLDRDPQTFLHAAGSAEAGGLSQADIEAKIAARKAAKAAKDFKQADAIRAELLAQGVVLEDKSGGATEWRRA